MHGHVETLDRFDDTMMMMIQLLVTQYPCRPELQQREKCICKNNVFSIQIQSYSKETTQIMIWQLCWQAYLKDNIIINNFV